jgi:hypothetical protein
MKGTPNNDVSLDHQTAEISTHSQKTAFTIEICLIVSDTMAWHDENLVTEAHAASTIRISCCVDICRVLLSCLFEALWPNLKQQSVKFA